MDNILVHIPHSSLKLPNMFWRNVVLDKEKILKDNLDLCDYKVDEFVPNFIKNVVKFQYSRMFCDVERFRNDKEESMSSLGMGAVYTMTSDRELFNLYDEDYKEKVLREYYDKHHVMLYMFCKKIIEKYGECYLIDLHSFGDDMVFKMLNKSNNPDICIGVDSEFEEESFVSFTIQYFKSCGYTVLINYPYSGSMVPTPYYLSKDKRVKSLMIEINKRIYLYDDESYKKCREAMHGYFSKVLMRKF